MTDMDFDTAEDLGYIEPDGTTFGNHTQHQGIDALTLGTGYALYRHGQDRQTAALARMMSRAGSTAQATPVPPLDPERAARTEPVNALDHVSPTLEGWENYVGQEPLKRQLRVHMDAAKARGERMPHTLLASGFPGVGKTAAARLCAQYMGVGIFELLPPFNAYTLADAAMSLYDGDILFIDEVHKLADSGKRGAEILLKPLEEGVIFLPDGTVKYPADITIIGATTDRDKLPEPVVDRFKIKPYFQPYSEGDLAEIAVIFADRHDAMANVDDDLAVAMARACRGVPRIVEEMVMAASDLADSQQKNPSPQQLLAFLEVEPDGLTRTHIHYLTAMRQFFARMTKDDTVEYIVGEAAIQDILRETKPGLGRIERFLVERGLIDRTPRGRRLTERGIARAEAFIRAGKGASSAS